MLPASLPNGNPSTKLAARANISSLIELDIRRLCPDMVVRTIFVTRHGFRGTWDLDLESGIYTSKFLSPTKIPGDPPLVAYGVQQSYQLADALISTVPRISRIYSSPYYRCLETIRPAAEKLELKINADNGLGEWFGQAPFSHPEPATPGLLDTLFPSLETNYTPACYPPATGESLPQLYARVAFALSYIIADADSASGDAEIALVICTHAAPLIIVGRVLTGNLPTNVGEPDFRAFTAGLSRFERRQLPARYIKKSGLQIQEEAPNIDWTGGKGVSGGWDCVVNCDCTHLKGGEERGCYKVLIQLTTARLFSGDESFQRAAPSSLEADSVEDTPKL